MPKPVLAFDPPSPAVPRSPGPFARRLIDARDHIAESCCVYCGGFLIADLRTLGEKEQRHLQTCGPAHPYLNSNAPPGEQAA